MHVGWGDRKSQGTQPFELFLTHHFFRFCRLDHHSMCKINRMQHKTMNQSPKSTTNMTPLKRKYNSSILPDQDSDVVEVQGSYWPRLAVRRSPTASGGKKESKKAIKALRRCLKQESHQRKETHEFILKPLQIPLFDLSYDVPSLVMEDTRAKKHHQHFSPVTGRRLVAIESQFSCLVPIKPLRRVHDTKGRSNSVDKVAVPKNWQQLLYSF